MYEYDSIYDDMADKKKEKDIKIANKKNREVMGHTCCKY